MTMSDTHDCPLCAAADTVFTKLLNVDLQPALQQASALEQDNGAEVDDANGQAKLHLLANLMSHVVWHSLQLTDPPGVVMAFANCLREHGIQMELILAPRSVPTSVH